MHDLWPKYNERKNSEKMSQNVENIGEGIFMIKIKVVSWPFVVSVDLV
jgi:hypothetical protein